MKTKRGWQWHIDYRNMVVIEDICGDCESENSIYLEKDDIERMFVEIVKAKRE